MNKYKVGDLVLHRHRGVIRIEALTTLSSAATWPYAVQFNHPGNPPFTPSDVTNDYYILELATPLMQALYGYNITNQGDQNETG